MPHLNLIAGYAGAPRPLVWPWSRRALDAGGLRMDCCGVRAIVDVGDRAREPSPPAALVHGSLNVDRVLALTWHSEAAEIAGRELVESSVPAMARRARGDPPA